MSLNILVVDDSTVMRMMVIKSLKLAGLPVAEIYQAANGLEGLAALEEHWVDLVFADINMPVMNGEEMIDRIRDNDMWCNLPIIVISTEGSQTRIDQLEKKGTKFVHKPFTPEKIRDIVKDMTGINYEQQI